MMKMNIYCPHCNALLPKEAAFCPYCARSIKPKFSSKVPKHLSKKRLRAAALITGFLLVSIVLLLIPYPVDYDGLNSTMSEVSHTDEDVTSQSAALQTVAVPPAKTTTASLAETTGSWTIEGNSMVSLTNDYTTIYVPEDSNGYVSITPDIVQQYIPESTTSFFDETHRLGSDLEDYIKDSYPFADLISRGIGNGINGQGSSQATGRSVCLFVFQWKESHPYLIGYFVGRMEASEDGRWCLKVIPCNYDLTPLYKQEHDKYMRAKDTWTDGMGLLANYIAPEDVFKSGAAYFIKGYSTGNSADMLRDDCQMYHLWLRYQSPYRSEFAKEIETYGHYAGLVREGRYQCFLLLDKDFQQIGYTIVYGGN